MILTVALSAILLCSCAADAAGEDLTAKVTPSDSRYYSFKVGETNPPNAYNTYKVASQSFALNMLKTMSDEGGNVFLSPMALYGQLGLLQNAANGATQKEIKQLVSKNLGIEELNECNGYFFSRLEELSSENSYVGLSADMFINDGVIVSTDFLQKNADSYSQGVRRLGRDENTPETINEYLSEKTGYDLSGLFTSFDGDIDLSSTAYLKDKWLDGYKSDDITKGTFSGTTDSTATFMHSTELFLKGKNCTGFIRDYKNTPCRFVALLPNEGMTASELAQSLSYDEYQNIIGSMNIFTTCEAYLPQFKAEKSVECRDALARLGVNSIFENGDFAGLSFNQKATVNAANQHLKFSVNAAGSDVKKPGYSGSTKIEAKKEVYLNRPFVFMIIDNESNIPIFEGIVSEI